MLVLQPVVITLSVRRNVHKMLLPMTVLLCVFTLCIMLNVKESVLHSL